MFLHSISRNAVRSLVPKVEAVVCATQRASASSLGGMKGYSDKEAAEEAVFFHKEDEKLLKKLLSKVRAQAEVHDQHSAAGARAVELSSLNEIVGDKLTDAQKEALLEWKHAHH
ncbi:hypothetical protein NADE_008563 [Nannochloris sp. 'desiccata']|nr:hypothetical protein NADE_008563 [Chlorella desiccata (nom. nud.)]